jgi:Leucine-rich repeat (LRR) protein
MIKASMTPEPRRMALSLPRPLWLGLAAVVMAVTVLVLQVGVPIYREQVARSDLERAGGVISTRQGGPEWLRRQIGDARMKFFDHVVKVDLSVKSASDGALARIAGLSRLEQLWLGNTRVSDGGLAHLKGLTSLKQLWLGNTQVTDAGLAHLKERTNLENLSLSNTQIGDAGLMHLKGLKRLQKLSLGNTRVTDAGVADLERALPGLRIVR